MEMATPANDVIEPSSLGLHWRLDCRGSFLLRDRDGRDVTPRGRKARAILAYLAVHPNEHVSRERLIELLWPDRGEAQARGSLRQSLLEIRRAAPKLIDSDHDHVWIDSKRVTPSDFPDECSPQEQLLDDLEGITAEYDEWLRCERAVEASEKWADLERKVEKLLARGNGADALPLIERMQRIDPYNEDWLRLAMRAECQAGHPAGIQTRFRQLDQLLKRELGVSLSAQTRALHNELLAELSAPLEPPEPDTSENVLAPPPPPARAPTLRRRPWLAAAGIAVLVTTLGLSHSAQTASAEPARIAVLPFRALGGVDSVLAEGMAEEVLGDLSQQSGLRTVGRTSSWMFKDKAEDLRRVGRKLDVRYIVEGSLRQTQGALRLNVALIDTRDASTLWSGRFTSPSGDAQRIENAASGAILRHLGVKMVEGGRHADPRAYALYVRAKALIRSRNWNAMREARGLLQQAVGVDPEFAPAWAQLGGVINFLGPWDSAPSGGQDAEARALAAARKAIALDPNLAEAHQMMAFILGLDTAEGRAHLRRALQLDPNNPQTLYWWSNAAGMAGNAPLQEKAARRALALDPLWVRPAEMASIFALHDGRRAEAFKNVDRLRAADPDAALQVEMSLSYQLGDLSRVVELGRAQGNMAAVQESAATMTLVHSLMEMGYVREGLIISGASPLHRLVRLRKLPGQRTILLETSQTVGHSEEPWMLTSLLFELARTNRHADIAALFDRPGSAIGRLQRIEDGNRKYRSLHAAMIGQALLKQGRGREAAQLFRAADEANRVILANGNVPPVQYAELAISEAFLGRKSRAIAHLERAVAKGWFALEGTDYRLDEVPGLVDLRGEPRFDRLVRITNARRNRERRETEALGLI